MIDWNLNPAWTELQDIVKQQVTSDTGITDEMFNLLMENVQYCKNNLGMSDVRIGSVVTNTLEPGNLASVTCTERLIDNYTYLDFVFNIPRGKDGMGTYINGEPTAVYFTSNPQSQINDLKQQNTSQSSQIENLGQADQNMQSQIDVLKKLYAVGSIYMSTDSTSPASIFGGTWEQIKDKFLLGSGDSYGAGTTGGSASVKLTGTNMSDYMLDLGQNNSGETKYIPGCYWDSSRPYANGDYVVSLGYMLNSHGGNNYVYNQPHENMPPYLAVYIWKRTA